MSRKLLNFAFIIIGVLAFYLVYQFGFKHFMDQVDEVQVKIDAIDKDIQYLDGLIKKEPYYTSCINEYTEDIQKKSKEYASDDFNYDIVMYACGLEEYVGEKHEEDTMFVYDIEFPERYIFANFKGGDFNFDALADTTTFVYSTDYEGMKCSFDYLNLDDGCHRTIDYVELNYNRTNGEVTASVDVTQYMIQQYGVGYKPSDIPECETGTENIFGGIQVPKLKTEER